MTGHYRRLTPLEAELFMLCEITGTAHPDFLPPLSIHQVEDWRLYREQYGYLADWYHASQNALHYNLSLAGRAPMLSISEMLLYYDPPLPEPEDLEVKIRGMIRKAKASLKPSESGGSKSV